MTMPPPIVYCEECNNTNVHDELVHTPQIQRIKMSDYAKQLGEPQVMLAVYTKHKHRLVCKDCGNYVEYYAP